MLESLFSVMIDDLDLEYPLIDGTTFQAHQKVTDEKGGLRVRPSDVRAAG